MRVCSRPLSQLRVVCWQPLALLTDSTFTSSLRVALSLHVAFFIRTPEVMCPSQCISIRGCITLVCLMVGDAIILHHLLTVMSTGCCEFTLSKCLGADTLRLCKNSVSSHRVQHLLVNLAYGNHYCSILMMSFCFPYSFCII